MENVSQELLERYGKRVGNVDTEKGGIYLGATQDREDGCLETRLEDGIGFRYFLVWAW